MKVSEFIESMHNDIDGFNKYWHENMEEFPEHYPKEMDEGEWFEQFMLWITGEE